MARPRRATDAFVIRAVIALWADKLAVSRKHGVILRSVAYRPPVLRPHPASGCHNASGGIFLLFPKE